MNRKGFAPIIILAILVGILALGTTLYYQTQKSTTLIPAQSITTSPVSGSSSFVLPYQISWYRNSSQTKFSLAGVLIKIDSGSGESTMTSTIVLHLNVHSNVNLNTTYTLDPDLSLLIDKSGDFEGPFLPLGQTVALQDYNRDAVFNIPAGWGKKFVFQIGAQNSGGSPTFFSVTEKDDGTISAWKELENGNGAINVTTATSTFIYTPRGRNGCPLVPLALAFASPKNGDTVSGTVPILVTTSNDSIITSVDVASSDQYGRDDKYGPDGRSAHVGAATSSPYALMWDTSKLPSGQHILWAFGNVPTVCAGTNISVNVSSSIPALAPLPYHPNPGYPPLE